MGVEIAPASRILREVFEEVLNDSVNDASIQLDDNSNLDELVSQIVSSHELQLQPLLLAAARRNCIEVLESFNRLKLSGFDVDKVAAMAVQHESLRFLDEFFRINRELFLWRDRSQILVDAIHSIADNEACIDMMRHIINVTMPIVGGPPRGNEYEDYSPPSEEEVLNHPNITDEELEETLDSAISHGRMPIVKFLVEERNAEVLQDQIESARLWARPVIGHYLISKATSPRGAEMVLRAAEFKEILLDCISSELAVSQTDKIQRAMTMTAGWIDIVRDLEVELQDNPVASEWLHSLYQ